MIIGSVIVLVGVLGGFAFQGGHLISLWQPYELMIILGAAGGAFIMANPMSLVLRIFKSIPAIFIGTRYKKAHYLDALAFMYELFNKTRKEGLIGVESDIEEPENSALFAKYPLTLADHHATAFISDYMRLVISGNMNPFELDNLMEVELSAHHEDAEEASHAIQRVSDALPAFGIVAAVLGIVHTMAALGGPIDEIGGLVAAALVGTFSGILIAYGFASPIATVLARLAAEETRFLSCLKACILANVQGYSPQIAVEFGRKAMPPEIRPSFVEFDAHLRGTR
nr:flagellar motor stator protein MotA [Thiorhodococcus mannitoliphagus]